MKVAEVSGALREILRQNKKNMKTDAWCRRSYDLFHERQVKSLVRGFEMRGQGSRGFTFDACLRACGFAFSLDLVSE